MQGFIAVWVGAMLGATIAFGMSRWLGRPLARRFISLRNLTRIERFVDAPTLLVARLVPVIAFNLVNYGAGLTRVPWFTFVWTTAIGIVPVIAITVYMGAKMQELDTPMMIGASAVLILCYLAYRFWRRDAS